MFAYDNYYFKEKTKNDDDKWIWYKLLNVETIIDIIFTWNPSLYSDSEIAIRLESNPKVHWKIYKFFTNINFLKLSSKLGAADSQTLN